MDLLTFELSKHQDELFLHGDPIELRRLAAILETLADAAEKGEFPHEHLFSAGWGGSELGVIPQEQGHRCLHHVKIFGWPDARGALPYNPPSET